jgi:trans-2,3-dihydro-3-hydroxyanthranilate isomerase
VLEPRRYVLLDVFTDTPLAGNPLAVFSSGEGLSAQTMQALARELNLSETVFVLAPQSGGDARLRIFTPVAELPFAGHPVLGSAIVVGSTLALEVVRLETGAGVVPVTLRRSHDDRAASGWMSQPLPSCEAFDRAVELLDALDLAESQLPVTAYVNGPRHVLVALGSEAEVAALEVDMGALARLGPMCVSCFAGEGLRYRTRVFAPALGVPEDPATGSAAGPLAIHLARHERVAFGEELEIRQGQELGRPSLLRARVTGSRERIERVEVGGSAVVVARGEFML